MNVKRFLLAVLAVFVVFELMDFVIHTYILNEAYESLMHIWRPDMTQYMWVMYITALFWSFIFVYIFTRGYEGKGWIEGLRYGLVIGLLIQVVGVFNQWVIYPLPIWLVIQWLIFGLIEFMICGIVASLIYKPKAGKK